MTRRRKISFKLHAHMYEVDLMAWPIGTALRPCFNIRLVPRHERFVASSSWQQRGFTVVSKDQGASHVIQDAVASGSQGLNALRAVPSLNC